MLASSKGYCTTLVAVICTVLMGIGMQQNIFRVSSRFDSHCAATNALFGISSPFNSLCAATNALFGVETSGATIIDVGGTPNLLQKVTSAAPGATKNKDYLRPNTVPLTGTPTGDIPTTQTILDSQIKVTHEPGGGSLKSEFAEGKFTADGTYVALGVRTPNVPGATPQFLLDRRQNREVARIKKDAAERAAAIQVANECEQRAFKSAQRAKEELDAKIQEHNNHLETGSLPEKKEMEILKAISPKIRSSVK